MKNFWLDIRNNMEYINLLDWLFKEVGTGTDAADSAREDLLKQIDRLQKKDE